MKIKEDLDNQYQKWQEKIESRNVDSNDIFNARNTKMCFWEKIRTYRDSLDDAILKAGDKKVKKELIILIMDVYPFILQLNQKLSNFVNFVNDLIDKQGLIPQRIQQCEQFTADESFVGNQCVICMEDIEIGRNMMRLDCDGQHTFCQVCIERWFDEHKTCPTCRHEF